MNPSRDVHGMLDSKLYSLHAYSHVHIYDILYMYLLTQIIKTFFFLQIQKYLKAVFHIVNVKHIKHSNETLNDTLGSTAFTTGALCCY